MTSSVSGKRSPAELIAPGRTRRWRRESNPCARLCRPLPHHSATPPLGLMPLHLRADDGIRTRDPHLGKVMRYQLRYIRAPRARSSPVAKQNDSPPTWARTNPWVGVAEPWSEQRLHRSGDGESLAVELENTASPRPTNCSSRHVRSETCRGVGLNGRPPLGRRRRDSQGQSCLGGTTSALQGGTGAAVLWWPWWVLGVMVGRLAAKCLFGGGVGLYLD